MRTPDTRLLGENRWEQCLPGGCPENKGQGFKDHHLWRCLNTEDADVCSYCGYYRRPCRHQLSTRILAGAGIAREL